MYTVAKTKFDGTIVIVGTYATKEEAEFAASKISFSFIFKNN